MLVERNPLLLSVARSLDDNPLLLHVLAVVHNLSYDVVNEIFIAFSACLMRHLITLLHVSSFGGHHGPVLEASQLAYEILSHVSRYEVFLTHTCTH